MFNSLNSPVRLGLVVNPNSRYLLRQPSAVGRLRQILGSDGALVVGESAAQMPALIQELRARGVDVIAIVGGDASAGITVHAIAEVWGDEALPTIALLRGGTMNTVANGLGLPKGRPEVLLRRLLARLRQPGGVSGTPRATLRADGQLGFVFGVGVLRGFLDAYYAAGRGAPTVATAAATMGRVVASALVRGPLIKKVTAPVRAQVSIDGDARGAGPWMALGAGVVGQVGLGFKPFYLSDSATDRFHFVSLHGRPIDVVRDLHRVWLGRPFRPVSGSGQLAAEVVIEGRSADGEPCPVHYMLDGDLYTKDGPLRLTAGPVICVLD